MYVAQTFMYLLSSAYAGYCKIAFQMLFFDHETEKCNFDFNAN